MKTVKQLQDIFIRSRQMNSIEPTPFYQYVLDLVYKGHTVKDRLCQRFKLPLTFDGVKENLPERLQSKWDEIQAYYNLEWTQADNRIKSRFEKYRIELNEFLKINGIQTNWK
jgi:hypothetical protein